jgi:hypothetical protein
MAKLTIRRLEASTLLEVVISMVIILAVFTLAIGIFTRVTQSGFSFSSAQAMQHSKCVFYESITSGDLDNRVTTVDSIEYKKTVEGYAGHSDIVLMTIEANQSGKSLGTFKRLVRVQSAGRLSASSEKEASLYE